MKITSSRIATLLAIGENQNIEFKRACDGPKADTFESVCAFLNKAGGDLLLGVDDDGTVVGLPPKSVDAMIRNFVKVMNDPNLFEPVFDEDDVFRLTVPLDDAYSADRAFAGELSQTGTAQKTTQKSNEELDPNRQAVGLAVGLGVGLGSLVLNEVTANPQIKMSEIALKYHVSKRTVERIFGKLSQDGRIVRVGGKRFGHWEVIG